MTLMDIAESFRRNAARAAALNPEYTPELIEELGDNEVMVFGSNAAGVHAAGAARTAAEKFGAVMGIGEGLQGQSYALPTMGSDHELEQAAHRFIGFAKQHPGLRFFLTRVGCGIAGRAPESVAPLFAGCPSNVIIPRDFAAIIEGEKK